MYILKDVICKYFMLYNAIPSFKKSVMTILRLVRGFLAVEHFAVGQFAVRKNVNFG